MLIKGMKEKDFHDIESLNNMLQLRNDSWLRSFCRAERGMNHTM